MNPFATRSAAAELARLLDEPGARPADAAPGSPAALAGLAERVAAAAPAPALRPEFRDALRTRLVAVATVQASTAASSAAAPVAAPARALRAGWRGAVAAGGLASVVAVAGVGVASEQSLPGDPFYGVKRAGESVQLRLAGGAGDEGVTHLHHASTRLDEVAALATGRRTSALVLGGGSGPVAALAGAPDPALLTGALEDMDSSTRVGGALLVRAADAGDDVPLDVLRAWSREQAAGLEALLPALPAGPRERAAVSLALVAAVVDQVVTSVGAAADSGPDGQVEDPRDGLPAPRVAPLPSGSPSAAVPGAATTSAPARPAPGSAGDEDPAAPAQDPDLAPQGPATRLPAAPPAVPVLPVPVLPVPVLPVPSVPGSVLPVPTVPGSVLPVPALPAPLPALTAPALPVAPVPAVPAPPPSVPTLDAPALPALPGA